jgi:hypothetical protein
VAKKKTASKTTLEIKGNHDVLHQQIAELRLVVGDLEGRVQRLESPPLRIVRCDAEDRGGWFKWWT